MSLYHDQGVVLRTYKLGEADRIVVFLTRGRGKVRAVAKGVRKTKSRFGGRLEPTSHVRLLFYEGRELDIVTQAESIDTFRQIRDDLDRLGQAVSMLEACDQLAQEREANARLYEMLVGALRTLSGEHAPLVVPAFFLKVLALEGFRPQVEGCVACGDPGPLVSWNLEDGGLLLHRPPPGHGRVARRGGRPAGRARRPARHRPQRAPSAGGVRGRPPGDPRRRAPPRAPPALGLRPPPLADGDGGRQSGRHSLALSSQPSHLPRPGSQTM